MWVWRLAVREVLHRKVSSLLALVLVTVAVASLVGALTLLRAHDAQTDLILRLKEAETAGKMAALEDTVERAMDRLGYNATVLPEGQSLDDWYADDYAAGTMPEGYAERLLGAGDVAERVLARLRQKVKWEEHGWTVIVVGVGREMFPASSGEEQKPLVEAIPAGAVILGHELHGALGLGAGDALTLLGGDFTVAGTRTQSGLKDDVTIWMNLDEAQALFGKEGLINEVLIVEDLSVWGDLGAVREAVEEALPGCRVVQNLSETAAREHARTKTAEEARASVERERTARANLRARWKTLATALVPLTLLVCGGSIMFLAYGNVRERAVEIGTFAALGCRAWQVQALVLARSLLLGLVGGVLGVLCGTVVGWQLIRAGAEAAGSAPPAADPWALAAGLGVAVALSVAAGWLPARMCARQDPADVLRGE